MSQLYTIRMNEQSRYFGKDLSNFANSQTISMDAKQCGVKGIVGKTGSFISTNETTTSKHSTQNSEIIQKNKSASQISSGNYNLSNHDLQSHSNKHNLGSRLSESMYVSDMHQENASPEQQSIEKNQQINIRQKMVPENSEKKHFEEEEEISESSKQAKYYNKENIIFSEEKDTTSNNYIHQDEQTFSSHYPSTFHNYKNTTTTSTIDSNNNNSTQFQNFFSQQSRPYSQQQTQNNYNKEQQQFHPYYQQQDNQQLQVITQEEDHNANNFLSEGYLTNLKNMSLNENNPKQQQQKSQQPLSAFGNYFLCNKQNKNIFNNNNIKNTQNKQTDLLQQFQQKFDNKPRQNPQLVLEYRDNALQYMQNIQEKFLPKESQISPIRASIIDWLVEMEFKLRLKCETLHIAANIYDRFMGKRGDGYQLTEGNHRLAAGTALFMAAKYEEIYPPALKDFTFRMKLKKEDIVKTEGKILETIGFTLTAPTSLKFFEGFVFYDNLDSQQINLAKYMLQLALHDRNLFSEDQAKLACAAILVVKKLRNMQSNSHWDDNLKNISGFQQEDLEDIGNQLFLLLLSIQTSPGSAVYIKFSTKSFEFIANNCHITPPPQPEQQILQQDYSQHNSQNYQNSNY